MSSMMQNQNASSYPDTLVQYIIDMLDARLQPSAEELVQRCVSEFGERAKADLKEKVYILKDSHSLTHFQKIYLRGLIEERTLDKALVTPSDSDERRAIETGIEHLLQASKKIRQSKGFNELIDFMAKFRDYAPFNNLLVRIQNPSCSFYATAIDWKSRFNRTIKEDASPMLILAPMHPVMLVYDIDQTEGKALPESYDQFAQFTGEWEDKWLEFLQENAEQYKIRVEYKTLGSSNSGFATNSSVDKSLKMRIVIHHPLDNPSRFGVLCHEIGHILLGHVDGDLDGWWPSRMNLDHHSMEIEAEATAYIVTQQLGLNGNSGAYVLGHLKDGREIPEGVSLDNIARVAGKIGQMATRRMPEPKTKEKKHR